jgi:hypothetical protein
MSANRHEMTQELVILAKKNTLATAITQEMLSRLSDSDLHGLLMVIRAHRGIEDCLLQDALTYAEGSIEDFTPEDMDTAIRAWGGI